MAVTFDAGNMVKVAIALRKKFPDRMLVCAADNDCYRPEYGNAGVRKAVEAAEAVGAPVAIWVPKFKSTEGNPKDIDDLVRAEGAEEAKAQFDAVLWDPAGSIAAAKEIADAAEAEFQRIRAEKREKCEAEKKEQRRLAVEESNKAQAATLAKIKAEVVAKKKVEFENPAPTDDLDGDSSPVEVAHDDREYNAAGLPIIYVKTGELGPVVDQIEQALISRQPELVPAGP